MISLNHHHNKNTHIVLLQLSEAGDEFLEFCPGKMLRAVLIFKITVYGCVPVWLIIFASIIIFWLN